MKIIAIGWNYPRHNVELGVSAEKPDTPVIFMKPDTAVLKDNSSFFLPDFSSNIHYETELVVRIGKMGKCVSRKFARRYIDGVGLGVDFTARDLQNQFKEKGNPWELCKAFDNSAPISNFLPIEKFPDLSDVHFHLMLNGEKVQDGHTAEMFFPVEEIVEYVSKFITLKTGDLIFTGTPKGVGPVKEGDRLVGYLEGEKMFDFEVK